MEERARRIVEAAIELAEKGGFEAVRLRDVAAHAGVALGTLYRRFRSKEDLLLAVLELQVAERERRTSVSPPHGATPLERVTDFFEQTTQAMCGRPRLTQAVVRSIASGAPELTQKVAAFHTRMENLITASLRGPDAVRAGVPPSERERQLGYSLLLVWFASLTGWAGGLHPPHVVVQHTRTAARLMLGDTSVDRDAHRALLPPG